MGNDKALLVQGDNVKFEKNDEGFNLMIPQKIIIEAYRKAISNPDSSMIVLSVPIKTKKLHLPAKNEEEQYKEISRLLLSFGMPSNIGGYSYLVEAIILSINNKRTERGYYSQIYKHVAQKFKSTVYGVERSIRRAIELTWNYGNIDAINEFWGYNFHCQKYKPTNSEFISQVSEKLKVRED